MTVRCPSCSANLRVNLDRLGGRPSAKCPGCHGIVPLSPANTAQTSEPQPATSSGASQGTIVVTCQACKTRLKAPASRMGARSTCPKCRATVMIEATPAAAVPNVLVAAAGTDSQDEVSSASTRRIDSRMIGMLSAGKSMDASAGIDLDAFLKTSPPGASPASSETPISAPGSDPGTVAPLLNPPVAAMEKVAKEIRQAAEQLTRDAAPGAQPAAVPGQRPRHESSTTPESHAARRPARSGVEHVEDHAPAHAGDGLFPVWRGLFAGGLSGLLVGAAQAGVTLSPYASYLPPLPFPGAMLHIPEMAIRVGFVTLLGILTGFLAGAAGSPRTSDNPLRLMRCCGTALLLGLACGLVGGLISGTGVQVWPIANWMRDLLLVGLLTPALHRLLPTPRY